jgi:hypothetical protein
MNEDNIMGSFFSNVKNWFIAIGAGILAIFAILFKMRGNTIERQEDKIDDLNDQIESTERVQEDLDRNNTYERENIKHTSATDAANDEIIDSKEKVQDGTYSL